jgi:coenzyme F420-reducing hydrogenase alpha subunit
MDNDKEIYNLRKGVSAQVLQQEAKELLLSAVMMVSVLTQQSKQALTLPQRYLIKVMNESLIQLLELFVRLYDETDIDIKIYLDKENLFVLKRSISKMQIQKNMFNKLYQLGTMSMIVVTDLLEGFTPTNANVLLSLAETIKMLTQVLESLALLPPDGTQAAAMRIPSHSESFTQ